MATTRLEDGIIFEPLAAASLFQLFETEGCTDDLGVKNVIQKSIIETLRMAMRQSVINRSDESVFDDCMTRARASVREKVNKEETARARKKVTEVSKQVNKAIRELQGEVEDTKDDEDEVQNDKHDLKEERKRKLEQIKDWAEELAESSKKLKKQ